MTSLERFEITLELLEFAEFQAKRRFLECNPKATEQEIENHIKQWYCDKPLIEYEGVQIRKDPTF